MKNPQSSEPWWTADVGHLSPLYGEGGTTSPRPTSDRGSKRKKKVPRPTSHVLREAAFPRHND